MTNPVKASFTKHYALTFGENGNGTLRIQIRDRATTETVYLDMTVGGAHVDVEEQP